MLQVVEADGDEYADDQDIDSNNVELESLDLDHPEASGVQKSPEITKAPEGQVLRKCTSMNSKLKQLTRVTF